MFTLPAPNSIDTAAIILPIFFHLEQKQPKKNDEKGKFVPGIENSIHIRVIEIFNKNIQSLCKSMMSCLYVYFY